jgi:hypothetical protein
VRACVYRIVQSPSGPLPGATLTTATPSPMSIRCTCYCVTEGWQGTARSVLQFASGRGGVVFCACLGSPLDSVFRRSISVSKRQRWDMSPLPSLVFIRAVLSEVFTTLVDVATNTDPCDFVVLYFGFRKEILNTFLVYLCSVTE